MTKVGAQRAADLTGRSKSTIQRAMKMGKLSYEVDVNGHRIIDIAELERAFGLVPQGAVQSSDIAESASVEQVLEVERLKMRITLLEEQLAAALDKVEDLKMQRDQWQRQAQQVLLTSQYSQKQAEELKEELKERERRARLRRQQELERRMNVISQPARVKNVTPVKQAQVKTASAARPAANTVKGFDVQTLWQRILGDARPNVISPVPAAAAQPETPAETAKTENAA